MKKIVSALIIFCILLFTVSCGNSAQTDKDNDTPTSSDNIEQPPQIEESNATIITKKFGDVDYGNYEVKILSPGPGTGFYGFSGATENELWYEEETGSVLNDAIYQRNMMAEELIGIKIVPVFQADPNAVTSTIDKSYKAYDTSAFDIAINRLDAVANQAQTGHFLNLCNISTMNVSNSWWDKEIVDNFQLSNEKLYFIAGDINYYDDYAVQVMFFNEKLYADQGGEHNLYQLVRDGKWTFDVMAELIKGASKDLNGDGKLVLKDDLYGFADNPDAMIHFIYTFNQRMSQVDSDGQLKLRLDDPAMISTVEHFFEFFTENPAVENKGFTGSDVFKNGNLLFFTDMLGLLSKFSPMTDDFGILPMPKKDEQAERYTAYVSNGWATAFAIPAQSQDPEKMGTILETMSAFSTDTVTKSIRETMIELRWLRSEDAADMLPYVYKSKIYDWAGDLSWSSDARSVLNSIITSGTNTYVSKLESFLPRTQTKLDKMIEGYEKLD